MAGSFWTLTYSRSPTSDPGTVVSVEGMKNKPSVSEIRRTSILVRASLRRFSTRWMNCASVRGSARGLSRIQESNNWRDTLTSWKRLPVCSAIIWFILKTSSSARRKVSDRCARPPMTPIAQVTKIAATMSIKTSRGDLGSPRSFRGPSAMPLPALLEHFQGLAASFLPFTPSKSLV